MYKKIPDTEGPGHHSIIEIDDFEFLDPVKQISEMLINAEIKFKRDFLRMSGLPVDNPIADRILIKDAVNNWNEKYKQLQAVAIPQALTALLDCSSKKEQLKLLRGLALDQEQFLAFLLRAGTDYGYAYSQYRGEHLPTGMDKSKLPTLAELTDDGDVNIIGKTEMSKGQIKQSIQQRHAAVAKFLDRDNAWHCFFLTYKSLNGEESYKDGQPHMHYISSAWGLERNFVVEQLKSKNYKLPSLPHIDYERPPRTKENQ